jgi:hypothetical protein
MAHPKDDEPNSSSVFAALPDAPREMYRRFRQSDYPGAIDLARGTLRANPADELAQAVARAATTRLVDRARPGGGEPSHAAERQDTLPGPRPDTVPAPRPDVSTEAALEACTEPAATRVREGCAHTVGEMTRCFLTSDYPSALTLADHILSEVPDHPLAAAVAFECRAMLARGSSIPVRTAPPESVDSSDPHTSQLLRLVDGRTTLADIAKASDLAPLEALRLVDEFVAAGVLRLEPAEAREWA